MLWVLNEGGGERSGRGRGRGWSVIEGGGMFVWIKHERASLQMSWLGFLRCPADNGDVESEKADRTQTSGKNGLSNQERLKN